jgi:hypothetical protein
LYGAGLARSELAQGVLLDFGLGRGNDLDALYLELRDRHGKVSCPTGPKYVTMLQDWSRIIHRSLHTTGNWEPKHIECSVVSLFGPRRSGARAGLLSSVGCTLKFDHDDINYTQNGEKSWEIVAWAVLNGFYSKRWVLVGPIIASHAGLGPVTQIFSESRFTIAGTYETHNWGVNVNGVIGKRATWKDKRDRLGINQYYEGACSLLEAAFVPGPAALVEQRERVDTQAQRATTTLRHQPAEQQIDIEVRTEEDKTIDELLQGALGDDQFYEVTAEGTLLSDVVGTFGNQMPYNVEMIVPLPSDDTRAMWCRFEPDNPNPVTKTVIVCEGGFYAVKPTTSKPGAFHFSRGKEAVIRAKVGAIDRQHIDQVVLEARRRPLRRLTTKVDGPLADML